MLGFERPEGLIKVRRSTSALFVNGVEKQILIINLNHYCIPNSIWTNLNKRVCKVFQ